MGLLVLAFGLLIYLFGELSAIFYISCVSFVVSLSGIVAVLGGWKLLRFLGFPLLLLFLMIPLPDFIIQQTTFPLQLVSSRLATNILQILGIAAVRTGNVIDLGVRQLQVVQACSGLRYILALLALGAIFCYFYQKRPWKVAILLISLIPVAILANAIRVAASGVFPVLQVGFWHDFSGWLIFLFCMVFLFLANWILNFQGSSTQKPVVKEPMKEVEPPFSQRPPYFPYMIAALMLIVITGIGRSKIGDITPVPLLQSLKDFPLELGTWQGKQVYVDPVMATATGANSCAEIEFTNPSYDRISLWIAYYENQRAWGSVHSPFTCLTGGGWRLLESGVKEVEPGLPVRYMVMEQGGVRHLVYYWYFQRGRWLVSEYINKLYLSYDGLFRRRADGALLRLITPINPDINSAKERLTAFTRLIVPILPHFIKN